MIALLATLPVFSILQPLEDAVRWLLDRFHYNLGLPWAWAIVATTLVVRVLLVPLAVRQIHSMQALQRHAPEMKEIQRKYKGDRQKMNEEMMAFYKENHINPAASCLPMVAQLPVFISLYLVLKHFAKHVPAGSNLSWLHFVPDITAKASSHWAGYLLLVIYAGSQMASTYFMSQGGTMDKTQRRIMMFVPLIFISVISHFPTGLVIYWVTTNLWTVGQGLVTRRLVPKTPPAPLFGPKRSSRTPSPGDGGSDGGNGAAKAPAQPAQPSQPKARPVTAQPRRVKRNRGHGRR